MEDLEERLAALEREVGDVPTAPLQSLTKAISELEEKVALLETKEIRQLREKYSLLGDWVSEPGSSFMDAALTTRNKADIILASEAEMRDIAQQLEQLELLQQFINPSSFQNIPPLNQKLQPLVELTSMVRQNALQQHSEMEQFLDTYNKTIRTLSQQFVQWDSILSDLEVRKKGFVQ
eukprot:GILJ01009727.1.p1 GENE.GILJ01009727.1~~GILJ01009727.1.p1  ORF type:complete len:178 (+),score=33.51 GILJ01009727.1:51-584(+)